MTQATGIRANPGTRIEVTGFPFFQGSSISPLIVYSLSAYLIGRRTLSITFAIWESTRVVLMTFLHWTHCIVKEVLNRITLRTSILKVFSRGHIVIPVWVVIWSSLYHFNITIKKMENYKPIPMDVHGVLLYEVIEYLDLRYFLILEAVSKKI